MAKASLLIVSSEPLGPSNTLPSIFELAQARILQQIADVAILAVDPPIVLACEARALASAVLRRPSLVPKIASVWARRISTGLRSRHRANKQVVEQIPVYAASYIRVRSSETFSSGLKSWVAAAWSAYRLYQREHGPPQLVHAHGRFLSAGVFALSLKKARGCPYIYTDHSTYYQRGLAPPAAKPELEMVIAHASAVTFVSEGLQLAVERFLGRPVTGARVIPNSVDPAFEADLYPSPEAPPIVLLAVAALEEKKGIDVLLRAFRQLLPQEPTLHLRIAGEGSQRPVLERLAAELGLQGKIEWLGRRRTKEIRTLMDDAHIFVLPSRVETFGVVVIEAMFRGCPVVATRSGGPEKIIDDHAGVVVEPDDVDALAHALQSVISNRHQIDRRAIRASAEARYGSAKFLARMSSLFSDIGVHLG